MNADTRPLPGDIVMVRGGKAIQVYPDPEAVKRSCIAGPNEIGFVIASMKAMTYVLWSSTALGWCFDGQLRKLTGK